MPLGRGSVFGMQIPGLSLRLIRDLLKRGRASDDAEQSASWKESSRPTLSRDGPREELSFRSQGIIPDGSVSGFPGSEPVSNRDGDSFWYEEVKVKSLAGNAGASNIEPESAKSESSVEGHESMVAEVAKRVNTRSSKRKNRMMMARDRGWSRRYVKIIACKPTILPNQSQGPEIEDVYDTPFSKNIERDDIMI